LHNIYKECKAGQKKSFEGDFNSMNKMKIFHIHHEQVNMKSRKAKMLPFQSRQHFEKNMASNTRAVQPRFKLTRSAARTGALNASLGFELAASEAKTQSGYAIVSLP